MPLRLPPPPPGAETSVRDKLDQFRAPDLPAPSALGGSDPGGLDLSTPHETFVLGLDALESEQPLRAAQPVGWRYLLRQGEAAVAAAETIDAGGGNQRFALFNDGPFVASTLDTLERAAALPEVEGQDLAVRLLTVPGVGLRALWLHGDVDDLILPLRPAPTGVEPGRAYRPDDLFVALREIAAPIAGIGPEDETGT